MTNCQLTPDKLSNNSKTFFTSSFRFRNSSKKWYKLMWWIRSSSWMILQANFERIFSNDLLRTSYNSWSKNKPRKIITWLIWFSFYVYTSLSYWSTFLCLHPPFLLIHFFVFTPPFPTDPLYHILLHNTNNLWTFSVT